jgi:hypothetical protein
MASKKQVTRSPLKAKYLDSVKVIRDLILKDEPNSIDIDIISEYRRSTMTLGSYVTLDWQHKLDINKIKRRILNYSSDVSQKRPLNILMIASPGSGKSHFIKCLAEKLKSDNVGAITYNMASFQNIDDLLEPLEEVRNMKVQDIFPILFLDEFDSIPSNYHLLLPLLWDGEIHVGHRDLKLGKIIIILAGSDPNITKIITDCQNMGEESFQIKDDRKLADLLSRINGGTFKIPDLDLVKGNTDRRVDKICLTLSLLQWRFGENLQIVPWTLLNFIGKTKFRYGVRSITHFIDLIPLPDEINEKLILEDLKLPLNTEKELKGSSLAYHIKADNDIASIIKEWERLKNYDSYVRFKEAPEEEF